MTDQNSKPQLTPTALSLADTARLLTRVGQHPVTEAMLQSDIADGAPTNPDGTLNLIHYTAWLVQEQTRDA